VKLTKRQAHIKRWRLVDQVLDRELRRTSMDVKFKKMDAAYRTAHALGILANIRKLKQQTQREIRQRWLRLKTAHL
jgi:hypothetical protein